MYLINQARRWCVGLCLLSLSALVLSAQDAPLVAKNESFEVADVKSTEKPIVVSVLQAYYDPQSGISIDELIGRALRSNQEIAAVRMEIDKAKARLQQARLRPNPTVEVEHESGWLVGNRGDSQLTVGFSLPIEIYGRRESRIGAAELAIKASDAEVRNRERALVADILTSYAEALGALRELDATEKLLDLDLQTARFVQIRVNEGETPPLDLSLLQAEAERLRSRRHLAEGKLQASITRLKLLSGTAFDETLRLREQIDSATLPTLPPTRELAVEVGLRTRPDILLAQLEEQIATAGLRMVRAQSRPDLTAYTRYSQGRSMIDAPDLPFSQQDRSLTFGVSVGIPLFNKNQGAKTEAEIIIKQAQSRREFAEKVVRGQILAAYQRFEAAGRAVSTLQTAAIPRSTQNVETFRRVYEIGEIKITDLIAEQRRMLDTTRDLTEALTERYRAHADLSIAIGAEEFLPESRMPK